MWPTFESPENIILWYSSPLQYFHRPIFLWFIDSTDWLVAMLWEGLNNYIFFSHFSTFVWKKITDQEIYVSVSGLNNLWIENVYYLFVNESIMTLSVKL